MSEKIAIRNAHYDEEKEGLRLGREESGGSTAARTGFGVRLLTRIVARKLTFIAQMHIKTYISIYVIEFMNT